MMKIKTMKLRNVTGRKNEKNNLKQSRYFMELNIIKFLLSFLFSSNSIMRN